MTEVAIIGGDKREKILSKILSEKYNMRILGQPDNFNLNSNNKHIISPDIKKVIKGADVVIAPMSGTDEQGYLKSSFVDEKVKLDMEFFNILKNNVLFIIGTTVAGIKNILATKDINFIELAKQDDLAILNAIPTAEESIKIAIEETETTIHSSNILIMGLGKVGLSLAWRLKNIGAKVYSVTRSKKAIARGNDLGFDMLKYNELENILPDMDIIYNTVPALILTASYFKYITRDTVIIDLASAPGGIDFDKAEEQGIKAMLAPGLPGKSAPKTAGKILGNYLPELISKHLLAED
ncbi:MAG: dipicolinate synthase subunit DpsA [Bacillota bacterium]